MRLRRLRGDEGVTLALVLLVMLMFALVLAFTLNFVYTSLAETDSVHEQRQTLYAADGATDTAIAKAFDKYVADGTPVNFDCPNLTLDGSAASTSVNNDDVAVKCTVQGSSTNGDSNPRPPYTMLILGPGGISVNGRGTVHVGAAASGYVWTKGPVSVRDKKGVFQADGASSASAITSNSSPCSDRSKGLIKPGCVVGGAPTDPGYSAWQSAPGGSASVPATCTGTPSADGRGTLVTFSPGHYQNAAAFNALSKLCKTKDAKHPGQPSKWTIWWFQPGVYYFDFALKASELKIDDPNLYLIGGAPRGWSTGSPTIPDIPGGCDRSADGIQIVFANSSRLNIGAGSANLCPPVAPGGGQSISLIGLPSAAQGYARQAGVMLKTGDNASVSIQGTVYAPAGDFDLHTKRIFTPIIERGIVAHSLKLGASTFGGQTVTLPPDAAHAIHEATLTLDVCVGSTDPSTCDATNATLEAVAVLHHQASATPSRQVRILSWQYVG